MQEGTRFDHYEVLRRDDGSLFELGRGAMGITYKAFDTNLRVPVALKVINAAAIDGEVARQRFVREARAAAALRHRNVASVFHLGTGGDVYFYAMEFIDGETVEALIRRGGPLDPALALRVAAQVARALNAAQRHQLVHRDIKPANLMVLHEDDELLVKVIDFGLAKSSRHGEEESALSLGGFVGTPHFASPEQLAEKELDARSDLYSLGATLWYMLAGRAPFGGSIAQVMSQHLDKRPPFEQFPDWPAPVRDLLVHLLEKDPGRRPQTPNEARAAIERCLEAISGPEEEFPTLAGMVPKGAVGAMGAPGAFSVGSLLAGRYRITEDRGDTNAGRIFKAEHEGRPVRVVQIKADLPPESFAAIERDVARLAGESHPHLLRPLSFEVVDEGPFLVFEWSTGFLLTELLRRRRELDPAEVLPLVRQLAGAADFCAARSMKRLDLALSQVRIHFPSLAGEEAARETLGAALTSWPAFEAKANPIGLAPELSMAETWAGGRTVVGALGAPAESAESFGLGPRYVQALAALAYELLGGSAPALHAGAATTGLRCPPLASLTEAGNESLRRALDPSISHPSAAAFADDLAGAEKGAPRRVAPTLPASAPPPAREASTAAPSRREPPPAPARKPGVPVPALLAGAALLVVGGGFFLLRPLFEPLPGEGPGKVPGAPAPAPAAAATPAAAPSEPSEPPAPPPPTPEPTPSRQDLLRAALERAGGLEAAADWKGCIEAYVGLARSYPESDAARVRLELVLAELRRSGAFAQRPFAEVEAAVADAAALDVVSAQMLLADQLREREPKAAFGWYCRAAALGFAPANTQIGLLFSNGSGVERDLVRAVDWFRAGAEGGDAPALTCLAECHLFGKGVPKDEAAGIELLRQAVAKEEPRAMNLLGTRLHRGQGVPKDFEEARWLFARAAELGYTDALGNLAVLHMNGEGLPRDSARGADLLEQGAKAGSPFCMFLYARCLENGIGTAANGLAASSWYRKAASLGHPGAADWCNKNKVPFRIER